MGYNKSGGTGSLNAPTPAFLLNSIPEQRIGRKVKTKAKVKNSFKKIWGFIVLSINYTSRLKKRQE
jgi:hypothetical protein